MDPSELGHRLMSAPHREPFIETYSGVRFCPLAPEVSKIRIHDIAHALSNQCRFSGHVRHFYSVAEHSVRVSRLLEKRVPKNRRIWLKGLLHDASEAYLVDLPTPLKANGKIGEEYREAEGRLMALIWERFALPKHGNVAVAWASPSRGRTPCSSRPRSATSCSGARSTGRPSATRCPSASSRGRRRLRRASSFNGSTS